MFGFKSPWKEKYLALKEEYDRVQTALSATEGALKVIQHERDALKDEVSDLAWNLDEARNVCAMAAVQLAEIAGESVEGDDFPDDETTNA